MIEQLDQKLKPFQAARTVFIPEGGWINAIRSSLNMTLEQLGNKLQITRQGAKRLEQSEAKGSISLKSLKEVAEAMDLKLVYALIPKEGNLESLIDKKADKLARKIVLRTNQNMILEDQAIGKKKLEENIRELAEEIKRELRKSLWD